MTEDNVGVFDIYCFKLLLSLFFLYFIKLDQLTHGLKSVQLEDEDASKYFINYISDDEDGLGDNNNNNNNDNEHKNNHIEDEINDIDVSSLPNSLIITPVPKELFTDQEIKVKKFIAFTIIIFIYLFLKRMNLNNYFVYMILK
jgi:hypothetical protein